MDWSKVQGFNYQPSCGSCGFEIWRNVTPELIELELGRGKKYFPRMNAIRLWLSWDAFIRDPEVFSKKFEAALAAADSFDLKVMVVLFNRWHDLTLDWGGVYVDHFHPERKLRSFEGHTKEYLETIVGGHAEDPRICSWDLCNEPQLRRWQSEDAWKAEFTWLENLYHSCKNLNARAPITVGIIAHNGRAGLEEIEPISDVLSIHPYYIKGHSILGEGKCEALLDEYKDVAAKVNKPLVATEVCWGALDDAERVENIRLNLQALRDRDIGFLAYLLHHSLIADAHRPEFGPVGGPGNLSFIEADGSLRPGHDVFNEFCQ